MGTGRPFRRLSLPRILTIPLFLFIAYHLTPLFRSTTPSPGHRIQYTFRSHARTAAFPSRANAVKAVMQRTFKHYHAHAWGADEIRPLTAGNHTSRNGWAATMVDSLTTLAVMGLEPEFNLAVDYTVNRIDFTVADGLVDPFETTIRYLGALVSTVELIDHGVVTWALPEGTRDGLVRQAVVLAAGLGGAWKEAGLVWPRVDWTTGEGCDEKGSRARGEVGPARAGTNWLEFTGLGRLTGEPGYRANATRAWMPMVEYRGEWEGVVDAPWDITTGRPVGTHRSWGAGHDSYYEYLLKSAVLAPADPYAGRYLDRWLHAVDSTRKHLLHRSAHAPRPLLFLHHHRNGLLLNEMSHLACFAGGNLLLGGAYLAAPDILATGRELVHTCRALYATTRTGVGPEEVAWFPAGQQPAFQPVHDGQRQQLRDWGWWVSDARYFLRPETVESYFYAWRITGEERYREWSWEAFGAIVKATEGEFGYGEVRDVTREAGNENREDRAESFWSAETLKYLYLAFAEEDVLSLDEWVFSTEAHPFRRQDVAKSGRGLRAQWKRR